MFGILHIHCFFKSVSVCMPGKGTWLICFVTKTPKSIRFLAKPTVSWSSPILEKKLGGERQGRSMNSGSKTFQKQIKPSVLLLGSVYIAASQMLVQEKILFNIRTVSKRMYIPMIKSNATPSGFGCRQQPWHFIVLISTTVKYCWQGLWKVSWAVKLHWKLLGSQGLFLPGSKSISRAP